MTPTDPPAAPASPDAAAPQPEAGALRLGEGIDAATGNRNGAPLDLPRAALTTHGVIVGMTGSGKTGLGVVLLEEVLRSGVPVLAIDPKGDLGNLALLFDDLAPAQFAPWVDPGQARAAGLSVDEAAAAAAATWRKGLGDWGLGARDVAALRAKVPLTLYTPGSSSGVPLSVLGSLAAPAGGFDDDAEELRAEIEAFVSSLLMLAGIDADPMASREHILLATLIEHAWRGGRSLDLGELIGQVARPPLRRVGVFELDRFFPERDRDKLAMRLNGLIASPSFAPWLAGAPLDIQTMLFGRDGTPQAAVVYLPHLPDDQRMFAVTLLLSKVVSWMRRQPGTSDLRALIYMDEVFGFCPPTGAPPAKRPILTLLKQARAHGVGVVLATQNPVDLDYKAMSNAGTWMVGRLSTERDKARIVEALRSASGDVDGETIDTLIGGLGKRRFVVMGATSPQPQLFTTRFALSYLRGPLTRDEVERLTRQHTPAHDRPAVAAAAMAPADPAEPRTGAAAPLRREPSGTATPLPTSADPAGASDSSPSSFSSPSPAATPRPPTAAVVAMVEPMLPAGPRRVHRPAPATAEGVRVAVLDPLAAWAPVVGAVPGGGTLRAIVALRLRLSFAVPGQLAPHVEAWSAVWPTPAERFDPAALRTVEVSDRDLRGALPADPTWIAPDAPIDAPSWWRIVSDAVVAHVRAHHTVKLWVHKEFGMASRPAEAEAVFRQRTRARAEKDSDAEAAALAHKAVAHASAQRKRIAAAAYQVDAKLAQAQAGLSNAEAAASKARILADAGMPADAAAAARLAAAVTQARAAMAEASAARGKLDAATQEIDSFEASIIGRTSEIHQRSLARADAIEPLEVRLAQGDVEVAELALVWVPSAGVVV